MKSTLLMACVLAGCVAHAGADTNTAAPGDHDATLTVNSLKRHYIVHLPPTYDGQKPLPLVFVIHGGAGNARNAEQMSGMTPKADKEGFIVVYPDGTGPFRSFLLTWNTGLCCGPSEKNHVDDVSFFRAMLGELSKNYAVDPKRVYATGLSNGGMMAYRLASELADQFAAIAPVAAEMNNPDPQPTRPVPVLIFHGTEDEILPYAGGLPKKHADKGERSINPVSDAVAFWVKHDGCAAKPERVENDIFIQETYANGKAGAEVILYTVKGGGHAWFGKFMAWPWEGKEIKGINCTDLIWEFFKRHPQP